MPTTEKKIEPTSALTVAHGRKIFDQSKQISEKIDQLAPLLALLDQPESEGEEDPIAQIVAFLETLANQSQEQTVLLENIDSKLDILLGGAHDAGS